MSRPEIRSACLRERSSSRAGRAMAGRTSLGAPFPGRVSGDMYLMMYLDEAGKVVYTLKARSRSSAAQRSSAAHGAWRACLCLR